MKGCSFEKSLFSRELENEADRQINTYVKENHERSVSSASLEKPDLEFLRNDERIDRAFRGRRRKDTGARVLQYSGRAALILLPILIAVAAAMINVNVVRAKIINLLIDMNPEYTSVRLSDGKYALWVDGNFPDYLPDGFRLVDFQDQGKAVTVQYRDDSDRYICFNQRRFHSAGQLDSENGEVGRVQINDSIGLIVTVSNDNGSVIDLYWDDGAYSYTLECSGIEESEVIRIAQSVKIQDGP